MTVTTQEKSSVPGAFNRVATSYDFLTALNPGYQRHLRMSAKRLELAPRSRILDLCCGTGRSTLAIHQAYPDARITALDFSEGMLELAGRKSELVNVEWVLGDATDPASEGVSGPFDAIYMAYGIRNLPYPNRCLGNLLALLRPGAPLCVHEYSVADSRLSQVVWNAITLGVVIPSGRLFAGSSELFKYLRRSVLEFDGVAAFESRLQHAGFERVRTLPMDGWQRGIVHSFLAQRPRESV